MRIIEQSCELIPDAEDLVQQIGSRAAICYQSDGNSPEANISRVERCIKSGHNSALEMGRITLHSGKHYIGWLRDFGKYTTGSNVDGRIVYSGSVRAWREIWGVKLPDNVMRFLKSSYPDLFADLSVDNGQGRNPCRGIDFPSDHRDYPLHKYQAVKFVTSRKLSHQLVRHRNMSWLQESTRYCRYSDGIDVIDQDFSGSATAKSVWAESVSRAEYDYMTLLNLGVKPQEAMTVLPHSLKTELIGYASLAQWKYIFKLRTKGGADPAMKRLMIPLLDKFKVAYPSVKWGR